MSLVLRYRFDGPLRADLVTDSSGNSNTLVNQGNVSVLSNANDGSYANFNGQGAYFELFSVPTAILGSRPRTFSLWTNLYGNVTNSTVFEYGNNVTRFRLQYQSNRLNLYSSSTTTFANYIQDAPWLHFVVTFEGSTLTLYLDGVNMKSGTHTTNTGPTDQSLRIGGSGNFFGRMLDFRAYDYALSSAEVSALYTGGPNPPPIVVIMYTHIADLTWESVPGATNYNVTSSEDSGPEILLTTTPELSHTALNLTPGSSYEFKVYTDIDLSTPFYTVTGTAPSVDSASVNSLLARLGNDLTLLDANPLNVIQPFIGQALSTDDVVITPLGKSRFVGNADTIVVSDPNESVLTSFEPGSGSGQTSSILLPDGSTTAVSYDENTDEVIVATTRYSVGEYLVAGGLKLSVVEF